MRKEWIWLIAILMIGTFFRLYNLGGPAFRADTMAFYEVAQQPISASYIMSNWLSWMDRTGQFPFAMAATQWVLDTFGLESTPFNVRLPSALWGILAILAAFGAGRSLSGPSFGLALAAIVSLNPYLIQVSCESYYYAPMMLGCVLLLWAFLDGLAYVFLERRVTWVFYLNNALGFFLITYSQPSGWWYAFLVGGLLVAALAFQAFRKGMRPLPLLPVLATYLVLGIPLLMLDWALPQLRSITNPEHVAQTRKIFAGGPDFMSMLKQAATSFFIGATPLRVALTVIALGASAVMLVRLRRRDLRLPSLLLVLFLGLCTAWFSLRATGASMEPRYIFAYLPLYLTLLTWGLWQGTVALTRRFHPSCATRTPVVVIAVYAAFMVYPAWWSTQVSGKPTPYLAIQQFANESLPSGSVVLVDRWFEPWNELRVYNSTNVTFTFTIPNEPVDVFLQHDWRSTARAFIQKYPDTAYLEISKTYSSNPSVGPWSWPHDYFARHHVIRNEAGLRLRALGLANRGDYYAADTNRVVVEYFWNEPEDLVARAQREGQSLALVRLPEWGYAKPNWQRGDFRDWRVMQGRAEIEVHNLTDAPLACLLRLGAVAVGGPKTVHVNNTERLDFAQDQWGERTVENILLEPGANRIVLRDPRWSANSHIPLFAQDIIVQPINLP